MRDRRLKTRGIVLPAIVLMNNSAGTDFTFYVGSVFKAEYSQLGAEH